MSMSLSSLLINLFKDYFEINFRFFSSNQEATHFRSIRFRRNLLELLYLKSCQRKHGERGGRAGAQSKHELPWGQPCCQLHPESLVTALPFNLQLSGILPVKAEGGAKRRGTANVNGVTKLEQLAFCLECEDSGPRQMTAAVQQMFLVWMIHVTHSASEGLTLKGMENMSVVGS